MIDKINLVYFIRFIHYKLVSYDKQCLPHSLLYIIYIYIQKKLIKLQNTTNYYNDYLQEYFNCFKYTYRNKSAPPTIALNLFMPIVLLLRSFVRPFQHFAPE